jgi:hypothetical protein
MPDCHLPLATCHLAVKVKQTKTNKTQKSAVVRGTPPGERALFLAAMLQVTTRAVLQARLQSPDCKCRWGWLVASGLTLTPNGLSPPTARGPAARPRPRPKKTAWGAQFNCQFGL